MGRKVRRGAGGAVALRAGPWSEGEASGEERRVARPHVSAATAGPGSATVSVVQLDEALEQEGSEEVGGGQGRFAQEWAEPVELEVAPLPCWEGLEEEERQRAVRGLVEGVESEARARATPVLGARAVRAQHPHTRPEHLKRSPRPLGHASTRQALKALREQYRAFARVL